MFKLRLKDGAEVSTLEELRDKFDLEAIAEYFKSGRLLTWLEDRFYDDEADAISKIDAGDDNFTAKICAALNVECNGDLEFMRRLREKKAILAAKTDDKQIIDNAATTAINQEDLATLIRMNYKTIYLCGEQFNVPIRIAGVKYIGILGAPKIKIRAQAQEEVDAQKISFENCELPFGEKMPIDELRALAEKIFRTGGKWLLVKDGEPIKIKNQSSFVSSGNNFGGYFGDVPISDELKAAILKATSGKKDNAANSFDGLNRAEKSAALRMFAKGKYSENQIAYMQLTEDLSSGFAFTIDSFCTAGGVGANVIPYNEIEQASISSWSGCCVKSSKGYTILESYGSDTYNAQACVKLFGARNSGAGNRNYENVVKFLEVAKNF